MKPIICSFYTPEYAPYAERMQKSAEDFGYPTDIVPIVKINDSWLDTIYYRAEFVLSMLRKHKQDIVWLDCDAIIKKNPALFENFEGDFGVHIHEWKRYPSSSPFKKEVLGGTMYFSCKSATFELIGKWIHLNFILPKQDLSQRVLQAALKSWPGRLVELPASYCQISDLMMPCGEPVIEHHQASRRFRNA